MVYKVVFDVRTPIITNTPIHFDALLSAVHPAMHNGYGLTRRSGAESVVTALLLIMQTQNHTPIKLRSAKTALTIFT